MKTTLRKMYAKIEKKNETDIKKLNFKNIYKSKNNLKNYNFFKI